MSIESFMANQMAIEVGIFGNLLQERPQKLLVSSNHVTFSRMMTK